MPSPLFGTRRFGFNQQQEPPGLDENLNPIGGGPNIDADYPANLNANPIESGEPPGLDENLNPITSTPKPPTPSISQGGHFIGPQTTGSWLNTTLSDIGTGISNAASGFHKWASSGPEGAEILGNDISQGIRDNADKLKYYPTGTEDHTAGDAIREAYRKEGRDAPMTGDMTSEELQSMAGFAAGTAEGLGKTARQYLSPYNLATSGLASRAKYGMDIGRYGAARLLQLGSKLPSAAQFGQSVVDTADPNASWWDRIQSGGNAALNLAYLMSPLAPGRIGPPIPGNERGGAFGGGGTTVSDAPIPQRALPPGPSGGAITPEVLPQLPPGEPEFSRQVLEKTPSTGEFDLPLTQPATPGGMQPRATQWAPGSPSAPPFPIMSGAESPEQRAAIEERINANITPEMQQTPVQVDTTPQRRPEDMTTENPFAAFEAQRQSVPRETDIEPSMMAAPPEDVPREGAMTIPSQPALEPEVMPPQTRAEQIMEANPPDPEIYQRNVDFLNSRRDQMGRSINPEGSIPGEVVRPQLPPASPQFTQAVTNEPQQIMHPDTAQANLAPEDLSNIETLPAKGPEYHQSMMNRAGKGQPGFAVEAPKTKEWTPQGVKETPVKGEHNLVYRDEDGNPVAMANVIQTPDGYRVTDVSIDKNLKGKAAPARAITEELIKMDALKPYGGMTPDSKAALAKVQKLAERIKGRKFAEQVSPEQNILAEPSEMGIRDWAKRQWEKSRSKEHPMIPHEQWQEEAQRQREGFGEFTEGLIDDIGKTRNELDEYFRSHEPSEMAKYTDRTPDRYKRYTVLDENDNVIHKSWDYDEAHRIADEENGYVQDTGETPPKDRNEPSRMSDEEYNPDEEVGMELGEREDILRNQIGQYAEQGLKVGTKELVQNALDVVRYLPGTSKPGKAGKPNPDGEVNVFLNYHVPGGGYAVTVNDNGPGIPYADIKSKYLKLTGSGKRGQGLFSGEMGVGKSTYLLGVGKYQFSTIVKEADGNLWNYEFEGTPEDMIKSKVKINRNQVPEGTPTGTTVTIHDPEKGNIVAAKGFLESFAKYSSSPVAINMRSNEWSQPHMSSYNLNERVDARTDSPGKFVGEGDAPGGHFKVSIPDNANWGESRYVAGIINSRGAFQGVDEIYVGDVGNVPDRVIIEVQPNVPATDRTYPLTSPTRERMKADFKTPIERLIQDKIAKAAQQKKKEAIQKAFDNLKPAMDHVTGKRNTFVIHDSGKRYTADELSRLNESPRIKRVAGAMERLLSELDSMMNSTFTTDDGHDWNPDGQKLGNTTKFGFIVADPESGGINIPNPRVPINSPMEFAILINLFGTLKNMPTPQKAANKIIHIIMHEFNHNMIRAEGARFTWQFAETYGLFDMERQLDYKNEILKALTGPDGKYAPEIQELLSDYTAARGRGDTEVDLLERARRNEYARQGPGATYRGGDGPDGAGILSRAESPKDIKNRTGSKEILGEEVGVAQPTATQAKLQTDLQGAQPRFNIAGDSYIPKFESDIDKALFIIAQKTPSQRDADYLKFVMKQTGMNEVQARMAGMEIRRMIKNLVSGKPAGEVAIPVLNTKINRTELFTGSGGGAPPQPPPIPKPTASAEPPRRPPPLNKSTAIDVVGRQGGGGSGSPPRPPRPPSGGVPPSGPPPDSDMTIDPDTGGLGVGRKTSNFEEAWNLTRGLKASYDLSAPLRQGVLMIHKPEFWRSLVHMVKSGWSEEQYQAKMKEISDRELFRPRPVPGGGVGPSFAKQAGLKLTDLAEFSRTGREEAIPSTWAETGGNIKYLSEIYRYTIGRGVRASNRAYTAFINTLRADSFESLMHSAKVFGVDGEANLPLARAMTTFINNATGRGDLGKMEQAAHILNMGIFSPRLIKARLHFMNPANYIMGPPAVRNEYLKSLFAIAAFGNLVLQLGRLAGYKIETDPNSADFGKLVIGNVRLDPWGGFQQYIVAANRLVRPGWLGIPGLEHVNTGIEPIDVAAGYLSQGGQRFKSSVNKPGEKPREYDLWNPKPGPYDPTHKDIIERFAWGKSHPVVNFALGFLNRRTELSGRKMNFTSRNPFENTIMQQFLPILWQDLYDAGKEDPRLIPLVGIPSFFGMGAQSYSSKGVGRGQR